MMFECQPPDNELFYDCGMKPISVRQCPPQPPCITPGMAIWVVKFPWEGCKIEFSTPFDCVSAGSFVKGKFYGGSVVCCA